MSKHPKPLFMEHYIKSKKEFVISYIVYQNVNNYISWNRKIILN